MTPQTTPIRLNLKKDEKLEIDWQDGRHSLFTISALRSMCPCAQCKLMREEPKKKSGLTILPGNYAEAISVVSAEMVGNYAIKLVFSDQHDTGIYSFDYLRELDSGL